jgi:tripartite-type tricarboxylate transporter receptor subunit TctC
VPTVAEQGFPGADLDIWFGMWAPKGTPPEVLARLGREIATLLAQPALKARYGDLGAETAYLDNAEFRKLLAEESARLAALIRQQKIIVD